jgi:hypothetical protein
MNAFGWRCREENVVLLRLMLEIVQLEEYFKQHGRYFILSTYKGQPNLVIGFFIILYKDIVQ